jgi:hypothetical protein
MHFKYRLFIGLSLFLVLGIIDYKKNPQSPTKVKEYLFLFSIVGIAMLYGIIHDFITYHISPEYFIMGKGIESAKDGFNFDVVQLAMMALWSVGLIIGVIFLIANNPYKKIPQLKYSILYRLSLYPVVISFLFAVLTGVFFYFFGLDFSDWLVDLEFISEKKQFMTTWGIHTGSYLGGIIGLAIAVIRIAILRKSQG